MGLSGMLLVFRCGLAGFLNTQFSKKFSLKQVACSGLEKGSSKDINQRMDAAKMSSFFGRLEKTSIMFSELK